jgi:hypothetical protein
MPDCRKKLFDSGEGDAVSHGCCAYDCNKWRYEAIARVIVQSAIARAASRGMIVNDKHTQKVGVQVTCKYLSFPSVSSPSAGVTFSLQPRCGIPRQSLHLDALLKDESQVMRRCLAMIEHDTVANAKGTLQTWLTRTLHGRG